MRFTILAVALVAVAFAGSTTAEDKKEAKKEAFTAESLVATWKYVSGTKNGTKVGEEALKPEVVITKDMIKIGEGDMKFEFKYTLDMKANPVTIDMEMTASPFGAGMKAKGIVSVEGDEMKLCYASEGDRPAKFDGAKAMYFVLKKKK